MHDCDKYKVIVVKTDKSDQYVAFSDDMPQAIGQGNTIDAAMKSFDKSLKTCRRVKRIMSRTLKPLTYTFDFDKHSITGTVQSFEVAPS